jgi:hypothetical protein
MTYEKWIKEHYDGIGKTIGKCHEACKRIKEAFPELRITNGFVHLPFIEEPQMHWWCVDPSGNIVDPTAYQYIWNGTPIAKYEEIDDTHDARNYERRKCMNCGKYYYLKPGMDTHFDSEKCSAEYEAYMNG